MEPMKRMTVGVAIIFLMAIIAFVAIYIMIKNFEGNVELRSVFDEKSAGPQQEEIQAEPANVQVSHYEPEALPKSGASPESLAPDQETSPPSVVALESQIPSDVQRICDVIKEEDISKYLKVKDAIFPVYNERKTLADMMLDQERLWSQNQIRGHMFILMKMKVKKKQALGENELSEKRFHYITNALMEWILRTDEIEYEKKYIGEEDFFSKKTKGIVPCDENDNVFRTHREDISKTFMGDFELVDY